MAKHLKAIVITVFVPDDKADAVLEQIQTAVSPIHEPLVVICYKKRFATSEELSHYIDGAGSEVDNAQLALPPIKREMRVRLKVKVDRYPKFILPDGLTGTVVNDEGDGNIWVDIDRIQNAQRDTNYQLLDFKDAEDFWKHCEVV